jgi:hypothetical protein
MLSALILVLSALGGRFCCGAEVNEAMAYEIIFTSSDESEYCVHCGLWCYLQFTVYLRKLINTFAASDLNF